jgi:Zn-dependent protease
MESSPPPVFTVEPPGALPPPRPRSGGLGGYGKTFLSMLLMIAVFAWLIGNWEIAAGVVLLIFVHEMGHVAAAMVLGIPISAPIFIPFLGAAIVMRQNPRDAVTEAIMAYAGPLAGGAGSWACLLVAQSTGQLWLLVVAMYSFQLNLFNLIPVPPLDGGRVCAAVSRWFWLPGLLLLVAAMIFFHAWQMLLIGALILFSAFQRIKDERRYHEQMRDYYRIALPLRIMVALFYLGLIATLLVGLAESLGNLPGGFRG